MFFFCCIYPTPAAFAKPAPGIAGTLSIIPGLGQVANGDTLEGLGWFTSTIGLFFIPNQIASDVGYKIWQYNMYDAYRDAGPSHSTNYNVAENYIAFLNPLNLIDPFSVGFVGIGAIAGRNSKNRTRMGPRSPVLGAFFYGFVGLGEEGLFRGFLFPGFSDLFDSYVAGAVTSSILFSVSHLTNKQAFYHSATGLSFLFLAGMVFCWQTHYNHFDLRHSIFAHAWYDFLVDYGYQTTSPLQSNTPTGYGLRFGFDLR